MKTRKLLGILLVSTMTFVGCADRGDVEDIIIEVKDSAMNEPQKVEVKRGDLQVAEYYDVQVGPRIEQLTFAEEGTFGEFCVQLGDTVEAGDIIATPVMENIEKAIENKEKELEKLTITYNYQKASLENDVAIVKQELDNAYDILETLEYLSPEYTEACKKVAEYDEQCQRIEIQLRQLQETYELELPYYEKQLKRLRKESNGNMIRAPFDGTIVALADTEYGEFIDTEKYYVAVGDTSVDYARCEKISTTVLSKYKKVLFWKDGMEYETTYIPMDYSYYMETQNNSEGAYSEFEIIDPNGEVSSGDYGKLKVIMEENQNVLLAPENTIQSTGRDYYVYKDVNGVHERVAVKIGNNDGINVEILEGLEEGDIVYVQE